MAYYNRGWTYGAKGQYDQAIADYTRALEINPTYGKAYANWAIGYYLKKEYDKAWDDVNKARKLGHKVDAGFLNELRKASGKEK